jgi:hypothetical protein
MAVFTPQEITPAGVTPTFAAVDLSNTFDLPDSRAAVLRVKNASAAAVNLTVFSRLANVQQGAAKRDLTGSIAAGGEKEFLVGDAYADEDDIVTFDLGATASVTAAVTTH